MTINYSYEQAICEIGNKNMADKIEIHKAQNFEAYAIKLTQTKEAFYLMNNCYQIQIKVGTIINHEGKDYTAYTTENLNFDHFLALCEYLETVNWENANPQKGKKK